MELVECLAFPESTVDLELFRVATKGDAVCSLTALAPAFFASSVIFASLPGANGVVELSPFEFLDRRADLVPPPPLAPARGPPTDLGELV